MACAGTAFLIWGLSPLYWKLLAGLPPWEIILHRIVWSLVVLLPLTVVSGRLDELRRILTRPRLLWPLAVTALLVAANWLLYIWAVNSGHVLQASLGYYINPLVNVLLGAVFLGERLRTRQRWAVALATVGVSIQAVQVGQIPWISLALAFSFGFYGLLRKRAAVGALTGLTVEALLLTIPALAGLVWLEQAGRGAFGHQSAATDLLLAGTALVTALPLLLFNLGARRIHLATVGILQYIAPSGMFLLAVGLYQEPVSPAQWATFALIWTALALYSGDGLVAARNPSGRSAASDR